MAAPTINFNPTYKSRANNFTGYQDITYTAKAIGMSLKSQQFFVPIGTVHQYSGLIAPDGYFLCDGSAVSRSIYTELFNVIGTTYGVGDGSTTFNLPNLKARVAVGKDSASSYAVNLGDTGGEYEHKLTIPEMPAHVHTGVTDPSGLHNHGITDPGHTHSYVNQPYQQGCDNALDTEKAADNVNQSHTTTSSTTGITINNDGTHTHTFTTDSTGGDQPHNNLQPYIVLNYIIKYT
jgi:microcystin-dependent protein